ncbi:MAG TPA: non-canonical purine NTP pyrophosphatase [Chloroflexota bacterium]|nr:non-canonical purine NTP pyrophosphatase [Chloroflexota bacterium]
MAPPIVLATSNAAKCRQLRWLLEGLPLEPVEADMREMPETAADLAGNAALKALACSSEGLAIASDGGLDVPALAGSWDPLLTHRQGQARLLELAARLEDRRVFWAEAVAVAERGQLLGTWTASGTEGVLAPEPWPPAAAFWVWDIFYFPSASKVWSALTPAEREVLDLTWNHLKAEVQAYFRCWHVSPAKGALT